MKVLKSTSKIVCVALFSFLFISCNNNDEPKKEEKPRPSLKLIPELSAIEMQTVFTSLGYQTDSMKGKNVRRLTTWNFSKTNDEGHSFIIAARGWSMNEIVSVDAIAGFPKKIDDRTKEFFAITSAFHYKNSDSAISHSWINRNLEKGGDTIINGVNHRIELTSDTARTLILFVE
jgi:hypothetical protein